MSTVDLSCVKDCELIFTQGENVVLSGKRPWIFRKDGTFVAKLKSIRQAYNVFFLKENTIFVGSQASRSYYHISLEDGRILWSAPQKGKRTLIPDKYALPPDDGSTIYHIYGIGEIVHVDVINVQEQSIQTYVIPSLQGVVRSCYFGTDGLLTILFSKYKFGTCVLKWSPTMSEPVQIVNWLASCGALPITCNEDYILYNDFVVYNIWNQTTFNLLENSSDLLPRLEHFVVSSYNSDRNLLSVWFLKSKSTIIIDCKKRKVVAHYTPVSYGLSGGCLIENEFWMGSFDGIIKKPFPHFDEYPRML